MRQRYALPELLWLVLPLALVVAPHTARLPLWLSLVWAAIALWCLLRAARRLPLPPRWLRIAVTVGGLVAVFVQFGTIVGPRAGVALLVFLSAAKLLETEAPRDRSGLIFVGYFLLVAHFLEDQSLLSAAYMLLALLALTASLIASQMPQPKALWPKLRPAGLLLLQAIPLAVFLFILFPRLSGPLWSLQQESSARTGLSDEMRPGDFNRLILSEEIAFRASFDTRAIDPKQLYWRGPVLWDYDGRAWRTVQDVPYGGVVGQGIGQPVDYRVILEPHQQHWLFLLGLPEALPRLEADLRSDLVWLARAPVSQRLQYQVRAWLDYRYGPDLDHATWVRALDLPDAINPRARALAARWAGSGLSDAAIVEQALDHFRREPFVYTLQPPRLGEQAVDDFLFNSRRGFCEHYASAFVFLMRAAGIPARVVTGYQGGEYNAVGNYWIVRQRNAHAWAEVWLAGEGWRRVDPTAAVAPTRVELGVGAALPVAERPAALIDVETGWLAPVRLAWDLVNYRWNLWVLGYNDVRQREFLARLAPWLANLNAMLWLLGAGSTLFILGLAGFYLLREKRTKQDAAARLYARFCRKLARLGLERHGNEGPVAFARRAGAARPDLAETIGAITRLYVGLRYGRATAETLRVLRQSIRRFRPRKAAGNGQSGVT
ncbi:uncharacterized protein DUF4129 [Sulfuritortus calidifontis]|uniref:Uncharacterized protein DUF4129 n=1 Tax=Sulfuritortus calidifontis TaxID=1914471 RepID=A0A4R3JX86_9PROT|nr:DUF3488 and transglutaminase-like domain-containing protein [Sulfuritortus calidifontis]TCS72998.1 uncharacterized protein DUF4129 [Sulfuritortus calidifontis]